MRQETGRRSRIWIALAHPDERTQVADVRNPVAVDGGWIGALDACLTQLRGAGDTDHSAFRVAEVGDDETAGRCRWTHQSSAAERFSASEGGGYVGHADVEDGVG